MLLNANEIKNLHDDLLWVVAETLCSILHELRLTVTVGTFNAACKLWPMVEAELTARCS